MPVDRIARRFQYRSLRWTTTRLPWIHSTNRNAPVPTGLRPKSRPYFLTAAGDTISPGRSVSSEKSGGYGRVR